MIWGVGTDLNLGDAISVTIIATGFPTGDVDILDKEGNTHNLIQPIVLKEEDVVLKPGLTAAKIRELENTPAFERRDLRIN